MRVCILSRAAELCRKALESLTCSCSQVHRGRCLLDRSIYRDCTLIILSQALRKKILRQINQINQKDIIRLKIALLFCSNLAQIDALLEMEPVALNSNIPPPPNFPPPLPPQPPPVTTAQSYAGENNSTGQYAKVIRKTSTTNDEVLYASSILYAKPTEKRSSKPLFPGHIHIPEPDYDEDVAYQG